MRSLVKLSLLAWVATACGSSPDSHFADPSNGSSNTDGGTLGSAGGAGGKAGARGGAGNGAGGDAARLCMPGVTQACTGTAACQGGQRCEESGLAWGPCDCGGDAGAGGAGGGAGGVATEPDASAAGGASGCVASRVAAEHVVEERTTTITEQVTTKKPVALFVMQDRSTSMANGEAPTNWESSTSGLDQFVRDAASDHLDVGLGIWPPVGGDVSCSTGAECGDPVVAIGPLPENANAIAKGLSTHLPPDTTEGTPTECALRGAISRCAAHQATTDEPCYAVFVTDGPPNGCDEDTAHLAEIAAAGLERGVKTFALNLGDESLTLSNAVAHSGGTDKALDGRDGKASVVAAYDAIRERVTELVTEEVTRDVTTTVPLLCEFIMPGGPLDPHLVNLELEGAEGEGSSTVRPGHVAGVSECTNEGGWYYDDPASPTRLMLCPSTCNTRPDSGTVLFGCATETAP